MKNHVKVSVSGNETAATNEVLAAINAVLRPLTVKYAAMGVEIGVSARAKRTAKETVVA
jgi:hypothetical protein